MANLDFSSIPSNEPLAEGIYVLQIEDVTEKVSSTGKDMLLVRFREPDSKTVIFENYVLTPDALWKLKELTDAIGLEVAPGTDSSEVAEALKSNMIKAKVIQDVYNERVMNRVKKVFAC